jgi:phage/plasmid-like protein (TIGR03299 family)
MAHEIAIVDGKASMMYTGEPPWHGLGTRLDAPATAAEAIVAAGLDYQVELARLATVDGIPVPQRKAVIRGDTQEPLGVVGNNYVPIQNRHCFNFLDAVVADGGLRYHSTGALGRGGRVWMLAKLPDVLRVGSTDDIVDRFLLLSNAHDGTASLRCFFTPIRVVCANTLALAHNNGRGEGVAIRHVGDLAGKVRQAQEVMFRLFERGRGNDLPGIRHTTWAAYNAVTEYIDYHRTARGSDPEERSSNRLASIWFGSGAALKSRAFSLALQMAESN